MKKYYICFFVLGALLVAAILTGSYLYLYRPQPQPPIQNGVIESETVIEDNMVINQQQVEKRDGDQPADGILESVESYEASESEEEMQYYLVAENGFLLVFAKDRDTVCLDTHMPLTEFPQPEQERLTEGIWFSTMIEIFNYLESYSS